MRGENFEHHYFQKNSINQTSEDKLYKSNSIIENAVTNNISLTPDDVLLSSIYNKHSIIFLSLFCIFLF